MTGLSLTPISKELYRTSPINYTDYKKEKTLKTLTWEAPSCMAITHRPLDDKGEPQQTNKQNPSYPVK